MVQNCELRFSDDDVVNPDEFTPNGEYNPHSVRPWLLHEHGFALAVVFADSLQDALDIAVDAEKLDRYKVDLASESERSDYLTDDFSKADGGLDPNCPEYVGDDGKQYWWKEGMMPAFLGNEGEPFDIETLGYVELRNPPFSFCALWSAERLRNTGGENGVISSHFA
jgi:hypothetical protein